MMSLVDKRVTDLLKPIAMWSKEMYRVRVKIIKGSAGILTGLSRAFVTGALSYLADDLCKTVNWCNRSYTSWG